MKDSLRVVIITVVLFVGGMLVGIWTQRRRPIPPPPIGVMGEFRNFRGPFFGAAFPPPPPPWMPGGMPPGSPPDPLAIRRAMPAMMANVEQVQKQLASIEQDFRSSFEAILTPEQKEKLSDIQRRLTGLPRPFPGCGPEVGPVFVSTVIYRPLYEHMARELGLSTEQKEKLKQLLIERRNKFLELVDNSPPPSFELGDMIPPPPLENKKEGIQ